MWISFHEARTKDGRIVSFRYERKDYNLTQEQEKEIETLKFLIGKVVKVEFPFERKVSVNHGSYCHYSRYDIISHKYAGGGHSGCGGYIQVLEIRNPPDGRAGIIILEYNSSDGYAFTEWETLESALAVFKNCWGRGMILSNHPGLIRRVGYMPIAPWFFAVGKEELMGDWVLPYGMCDDPVFRIGKKFVVDGNKTFPVVKTCLGCRLVNRERRRTDFGEDIPGGIFRVVYFDDGSVWGEWEGNKKPWLAEEKFGDALKIRLVE